MYTYVQRPGCKKENTITYVYIRAGSRTPSRAYVRRGLVFMGRQQNASCSWGGNGMRHVHGEARECVVFIGRAWTEQAMETRPGVPQNRGNDLVFDRPRSKRDPVHREGSGVPQNGGNGVLFVCLQSKRGPTTRKRAIDNMDINGAPHMWCSTAI